MRLAFCTRLTHSLAYSADETRKKCLSLMRATAQSVSVITTVLRTTEPDDTNFRPVFHGATLSSFTSIAMYPQPLVSFSLRTPSRMAESLHRKRPHTSVKSHLVINLLSASQAHVALQFSRPRDNPFTSTEYFLSSEGIPILHGCLGALSCTLVGSIPLGEPGPDLSLKSDETPPLERQSEEQGSELFVARVLRVEKGYSPESTSPGDPPDDFYKPTLPLVYHRQNYVTVDTTGHFMTSSLNNNKP